MSKLKVNELDTRSGTDITVTAGKTLDTSAGTLTMADDTVTYAKMQDTTLGNRVLGTVVQGTIAEVQIQTDMVADNAVTLGKMESITRGSIIYGNATSDPAALAIGTSAQVLTSDGSDISWAPTSSNAAVLNDIATLALQQATQNNQSAYNLANAFVDQYEDSTGIDTTTQVSRNTSGEYMSTMDTSTIDANTLMLLHMDGTNAGTSFGDAAPVPLTVTVNNTTTTTAEKKFGTAGGDFTVTGSYLSVPATASLNFAANASFTFDAWYKIPSVGATLNNRFFQKGSNHANGYALLMDANNIYFGYEDANVVGFARNLVVGTGNWHHIAVVRNVDALAIYLDGVSKDTATSGTAANHNAATYLAASPSSAGSDDRWNGYMDEFRISNVARWTSGFTPQATPYGSVEYATGNYTSTTEAAIGTVSKMGIVVLYKNESGTATLDTDLVAEVSANGGTNWTAAPLTAGGTFSTGILIAKSNDITVGTTGQAPKFRISFANQSAGVKETRVYGASLLY